MEKRFSLPYNWLKGSHTRHVRQKNGIWAVAQALAGDLHGKRVLDAGCGDGWYSAKMVTAGADVVGIDYSARGVAHAQSIVQGAEFREASITELPFDDASFDRVFSFQVLEHLPFEQVDAGVREIARVTKPGGMMIVSVPSTKRKMSKAHFQHFTEARLKAMFEPYAASMQVVGQDRRTPVLWMIERLIQNRWYTLEALGTWFNRTIYMKRYNKTIPAAGDNLIIAAVRKESHT